MAKCNSEAPLESVWSMLTLCSTNVKARSSCFVFRAISSGRIPWSSSSFNLFESYKKNGLSYNMCIIIRAKRCEVFERFRFYGLYMGRNPLRLNIPCSALRRWTFSVLL
jgi:hypothetical protein